MSEPFPVKNETTNKIPSCYPLNKWLIHRTPPPSPITIRQVPWQMRIAYFHEKLSECDVFSARVHGIVKDSWRNKARCGIACIGIKIKIFYSSWKIHHNTDATAEWKSELLAKRIKALLCFTRKQISASFLGVTSWAWLPEMLLPL